MIIQNKTPNISVVITSGSVNRATNQYKSGSSIITDSYGIKGKNHGTSGKSKIRCKPIPTKKGVAILKFPLEINNTVKNVRMMKSKLWETNLPFPNPNKNIGLSIISGNNEPITNTNLFILYLATNGISKRSNGNAI